MGNDSSERTVIHIAIASRLLLLTLIIFWRSLVTPYDTSASINPNCLSSPIIQSNYIKFPYIASVIQDSIVWDSVYFLRIAQCGYEYEQFYAFWPLLPFCIKALSKTGACFNCTVFLVLLNVNCLFILLLDLQFLLP